MSTRLKFTLLTLFAFASLRCYSQRGDSAAVAKREHLTLSLITGYNFWNNHYVELGFAINKLSAMKGIPNSLSAIFIISPMR